MVSTKDILVVNIQWRTINLLYRDKGELPEPPGPPVIQGDRKFTPFFILYQQPKKREKDQEYQGEYHQAISGINPFYDSLHGTKLILLTEKLIGKGDSTNHSRQHSSCFITETIIQ
jgi:hypothetical protein